MLQQPQMIFLSLTFLALRISAKAGTFGVGDRVDVSVNTVGPYRNPQERYQYWDKLPFCKPKELKNVKDLGKGFAGDRPKLSDYDIRFTQNVQDAHLCTTRLSADDVKTLYNEIMDDYTFEFFVDNLAVDGFVGEREHQAAGFFTNDESDDFAVFLFTHWTFFVEYSGEHIISCHVQPDRIKKVELVPGEESEVAFGYSVQWSPVNIPVGERLMYHQRNQVRAQHVEIHWLAIINSFVLVVLLVAFLMIILSRILKNDYARYGTDPDELADDLDDSGWKQVHGDVFRSPQSQLEKMLFASFLGTGTQMLVLTIAVLLLSLVGMFYPGNRGTLVMTIIVVYCFTSGIAGHVSGKFYIQMGGKNWASNAILTACIFFVPFSLVFCVVNTVGIFYGSTTALPALHIFIVIALYCFTCIPLTIYSASKVREVSPKLDVPCKTNIAPREIPAAPWYRHWSFQIILSGILPFTAIYIELHYVFNAVFGHRVYTFFGILCLAFLLLVIVASAITVTLTYFQLTIEDHYWWWRSFLSAGSTGFYIFAYGIFFWIYRSNMSGPLQFTFFFGYIAVFSYMFFLLLGAVGFFSSFTFVKHIYQAIKLD